MTDSKPQRNVKPTAEGKARTVAAEKGYEVRRESNGLVAAFAEGNRLHGCISWSFMHRWLRNRRSLKPQEPTNPKELAKLRAEQKGYTLEQERGMVAAFGGDGTRYHGALNWHHMAVWLEGRTPLQVREETKCR